VAVHCFVAVHAADVAHPLERSWSVCTWRWKPASRWWWQLQLQSLCETVIRIQIRIGYLSERCRSPLGGDLWERCVQLRLLRHVIRVTSGSASAARRRPSLVAFAGWFAISASLGRCGLSFLFLSLLIFRHFDGSVLQWLSGLVPLKYFSIFGCRPIIVEGDTGYLHRLSDALVELDIGCLNLQAKCIPVLKKRFACLLNCVQCFLSMKLATVRFVCKHRCCQGKQLWPWKTLGHSNGNGVF